MHASRRHPVLLKDLISFAAREKNSGALKGFMFHRGQRRALSSFCYPPNQITQQVTIEAEPPPPCLLEREGLSEMAFVCRPRRNV